MKTRKWVPPDWTQQNEYPNPNNTTPLQWAWEFLRRNPEYQRLWEKLIEPHYTRSDLNASWRLAGKNRRLSTRPRIFDLPPKSQFSPLAELPPPPFDTFRRLFHILTYPPAPWEQ